MARMIKINCHPDRAKRAEEPPSIGVMISANKGWRSFDCTAYVISRRLLGLRPNRHLSIAWPRDDIGVIFTYIKSENADIRVVEWMGKLK